MGVGFGDFRAVRDVSLGLRRGDLLGLVGPNGAGKTTLLRMCAGLLRPGRGEVHVAGRRLRAGDLDLMRRIGFTADVPGVYGKLTPRQFLGFVGRAYGIVGADLEERAAFWLEKLWLAEKADEAIGGLSRGMKQRMGLARTLLPGPDLVLLDEPASGLDPAGRVQFRKLLVMLREQGRALVVSSHILADMPEYCTHIGLMKKGRLLRYGTVDEVAADDGEGGGIASARYTLRLARHDDVLPAMKLLQAKDDTSDHERVAKSVEFVGPADDAAAAAMLQELVAAGVQVCGFGREAAGLEAAYLRAGLGEVD